MANDHVNHCTVVIQTRPKMLTGLNQKVCDQEGGLPFPSSQMLRHRRRGGA